MNIRQILIGLGVLLIVAGLLWPWLQKFGLFRLPGDIAIERQNSVLFSHHQHDYHQSGDQLYSLVVQKMKLRC